MIIPMLCVTIFVILVVWFLLPRVARLMIHTPTAISIFVCLSMVQLMAVFISMRCTLCGHFLQVALTLILVVGYAIAAKIEVDCWRKMRKFDLSLRSSRSSYFATFRHQLTILSKTDALDEEKWLNMLGTFVKDWFRYESHFVHGRDSLVDILKERGLLSESDAVQPLIGKKS